MVPKLRLPTWVKSPPRMLGEASNGKITADEWNTVCRIALPLLLAPIWGKGAEDTENREQELLENFIDLVLCINMATSHEIDEGAIIAIEARYTKYLRGLRKLFPQYSLHPNHHMFTHIGQFLRDFGPMRSWSAWAFERLNGLAQKVPNNLKFGELPIARWATSLPNTRFRWVGDLEGTLMHNLTSASALRAIAVDGALDPDLAPFQAWLQESLDISRSDSDAPEGPGRGGWNVESDWITAVPKGSDLQKAITRLIPNHVNLDIRACKRIGRVGKIYKAYSTATNDGLIQYRTDSGVFSGAIYGILAISTPTLGVYQAEGFCFLIMPHKKVSLTVPGDNPFFNVPELGCQLVERALGSEMLMVDAGAVIGHVVSMDTVTRVSLTDCTVVMPVGKVSSTAKIPLTIVLELSFCTRIAHTTRHRASDVIRGVRKLSFCRRQASQALVGNMM